MRTSNFAIVEFTELSSRATTSCSIVIQSFKSRRRMSIRVEIRLGCGLPSTLTPERISDVLELVKSDERFQKDVLDVRSSPAWIAMEQLSDFCKRLCPLIEPDEGRRTHENARSDFEHLETRLIGRTDPLFRLIETCLDETPCRLYSADLDSEIGRRSIQGLVEVKVRSRVSEIGPAKRLIYDNDERLCHSLDSLSEVRSYLR